MWRHAGTLVVLMFSEVLLCARCSRVNSEALGSGSCYYLVVANAFDLGLRRRQQNAFVPDHQRDATRLPLHVLAADSIPSPPTQQHALVDLVLAWTASMVTAWRDSAAKYEHRLGAKKDQMLSVVQHEGSSDAPTKVLVCAGAPQRASTDAHAAAVRHPPQAPTSMAKERRGRLEVESSRKTGEARRKK